MAVPLYTACSRRVLPHVPAVLPLVERLRRRPAAWLLESAQGESGEPGAAIGRYTFAGSDPYLLLRAFGSRVQWETRRAVRPDLELGETARGGDPLAIVRSLLPPPPPDDDDGGARPPFIGGAVGFWGYELAPFTEGIELRWRDREELPDAAWAFVDRLVCIDHQRQTAEVWGLGFASDRAAAQERAGEAAAVLWRAVSGLGPARPGDDGVPATSQRLDAAPPTDTRAFFDEPRYAKSVTHVLGEIAAGNVYQANLTHRLEWDYRGDPLAYYAALRRVSPAPFAAYLELPEAAIASSSPERFLRVERSGRVESRPIKGTRPRGASERDDTRLRRELTVSEKDRAENVMIVDLVRNDLGRVCETASIDVPDLFRIEAYATVFQLVSTVSGRLAPGRDAIDLVRAAFPPGSMTGAPKRAAMALLDRLEPVRRGVYSGALGYLDVGGGADLSVVIRTAVLTPGRLHAHVGGGIVADSDPSAEYRETLDKARALWLARELADAAG
ncbi:MAG: aminodeoxychorismate synthase component I [Proteobacteria bacterium]|nr:aminodeoxychorismate synthase component I [Pseudomonadota bacterium]